MHRLEKAQPELKHWIDDRARKLYVIRDGRSVLCSLHLYMQSFVPETRCSLSDFLRQTPQGVSRVKAWANHVQTWLAQPNIHIVRFEEVIHHPKETLVQLGAVLGLEPLFVEPLLPRSPNKIWQGRWVRLTQWRPESTAIIGYYGGQTVQKWQTAFTEADRAFFQGEAGDLLMQLGYVSSDEWVTAAADRAVL